MTLGIQECILTEHLTWLLQRWPTNPTLPSQFQMLRQCSLQVKENKSLSYTTIAKEPCEIVHCDVLGWFTRESLGKCNYHITFVQDKYKYTDIDLLENKSYVFPPIQKFIFQKKNEG